MHFASYYRWMVYREIFGTPAPDSTVLDIGCDDGGFIARARARLSVALDIARDSLRRVRASARVCADGVAMPFGDVVFDYVLLSDVIEHVPDDRALLTNALARVRPGGTLLLSTTASGFQLFPPQVTPRAERAWGHVRKGYTPERLADLIGPDFDAEIVVWPEPAFRTAYLLMWLFSKFAPQLSLLLAIGCFRIDSALRWLPSSRGHLFIRAVRRGAAVAHPSEAAAVVP